MLTGFFGNVEHRCFNYKDKRYTKRSIHQKKAVFAKFLWPTTLDHVHTISDWFSCRHDNLADNLAGMM